MRRHSIPHDEWQYRQRSSEAVRGTLLRLCLEFVRAARKMPHIHRIAVVGSLPTPKQRPKDADVLVTIGPEVDLNALAAMGRRFQGQAQAINSTADVFLSDIHGSYLGRVCQFRECHPRVRCRATHCGVRPHLNDDLDVVALAPELIASPPLVVHPVVTVAADVPKDLEELLLAPLRREIAVSCPTA